MPNWRGYQERERRTDRPDLAQVLEYYGVFLRSDRGGNQPIPCPVHDERQASASVRLDNGTWHCFACGKGGSAWDLIMEKEGLDFAGARAFAADHSFAAGSSDGGGTQVQGSAYAGRSGVSRNKGTKPSNGGYKPSWRR